MLFGVRRKKPPFRFLFAFFLFPIYSSILENPPLRDRQLIPLLERSKRWRIFLYIFLLSPQGSTVAWIRATDRDSGMFGTAGIRYTRISGPMANFLQLDQQTGERKEREREEKRLPSTGHLMLAACPGFLHPPPSPRHRRELTTQNPPSNLTTSLPSQEEMLFVTLSFTTLMLLLRLVVLGFLLLMLPLLLLLPDAWLVCVEGQGEKEGKSHDWRHLLQRRGLICPLCCRGLAFKSLRRARSPFLRPTTQPDLAKSVL